MLHNEKGFTLVEILLAAILMLLLLTGIMGFYINTTRTYDSASARMDVNTRMRHLVTHVSKDLQDMGYGDIRSHIDPLQVIMPGGEDPYTVSLMVQRGITYVNKAPEAGDESIEVLNPQVLEDAERALIISDHNAEKINITAKSGDTIYLDSPLQNNYDAISRIIAYNWIIYSWDGDTLSRRVGEQTTNTWLDVPEFQVLFIDNEGNSYSDPSTFQSLRYAEVEVTIDDKKELSRDFRVRLRNIVE